MRIMPLLLLPVVATAAPVQTVRTISAVDRPVATTTLPRCAAAALSAPVIRSISTTQDDVVSAVAVGQCLAATPLNPDELYPPPADRPLHASGQHRARFPEDDANIRQCVAKAAQVFHVEPTALYLILDVERGTLGQTSAPNADRSVDIGPMQINSWWLPKLSARGISAQEITNNLCVNIMTGAWIYAQERRHTKTVAEAIARYHSPTPAEQRVYLSLVEKAIDRRLARNAETEKSRACATPSPACSHTSPSSAATSPTPAASTPTFAGT
jgi:hypothetical protein